MQQQQIIALEERGFLPRRQVGLAYVLWFFFGWLGVHRFYLERPITGVIWLLTGGVCGVGWLIDLFLIPGMVAACNAPKQQQAVMTYTTTTTTTTTSYGGTPVHQHPAAAPLANAYAGPPQPTVTVVSQPVRGKTTVVYGTN